MMMGSGLMPPGDTIQSGAFVPGPKALSLPPAFNREEFDSILITLTQHDISDIHIESNQPIWVRQHGALYRLTNRRITQQEVIAIAQWCYATNAIGELAKVRDLHNRYDVALTSSEIYRYRVNIVSTSQAAGSGYRLALRSIPRNLPRIEDQEDLDPLLVEAFLFARGLGLVVGETGNGKSTLLAALNRELLLHAPNRRLLTYEDPIEFDLTPLNDVAESSHVCQHAIGESVQTFYDGVVNSLRSWPTDILIGEAKDRETISASIHSAETGHKTCTTVHAGSVRETIMRIASEFPLEQQPGLMYKLISNLNFIVVQKLMGRPNGGRRYPLREWLVLTNEIKLELLDIMDPKAMLTRLDQHVRSLGQDFRVQALRAHERGLISDEALKSFVMGGAV